MFPPKLTERQNISNYFESQDFRGHHSCFRGAFSERFGLGFRRGIALPKAGPSFTMKSSSPNKAIRPHCHAATATPLGHKPDVGLKILITKERALTRISSLSYMVRNSRSHYSCESGHEVRMPSLLVEFTNYVWCPRNYPPSCA